MYKIAVYTFIILCSIKTKSQVNLRGTVIDDKTKSPVVGATVTLMPKGVLTVTDANGTFIFKGKYDASAYITVNNIGYLSKRFDYEALHNHQSLSLTQKQIELQDVVIVSNAGDIYKPISRADIALRGVNNSQEILRIIPGIVIAQHQGGGKAEQLFLRGFDADHGTDFRLDADGLPINMVSHAHGQGFADSHFIIPETVESVDFKKGPYAASKGDFATTGSVDFHTKNTLDHNTINVEGGMFNTWRGLGMFNLLRQKERNNQQSWYVASEYRYSDAYFDNPQHFNRFNFFTKYTGRLSAHNHLYLSATTFRSKWDASGQVPERAVKDGLIGFYGAIDPHEGGLTYRTNINAQLVTSFNNGDLLKNQLYYSSTHFDLHTNFTFFLEDTVNGDEIRQKEARDLMGYNGSYSHTVQINKTKLSTELGVNVRQDITHNSELSHTVDRYTLLGRIKLGDITEQSVSPYLGATAAFNKHFSVNAGIRYDQYYYSYYNKFAGDTTLPGTGVYRSRAGAFSPKLNIYYHLNKTMQFYFTTGKGLHSNDTRAVVVEKSYETLPSAYSADLGTVFKPVNKVVINAALWYIYLQQEFVYSGDGGSVDFSGKTHRMGFDFSGRYQPTRPVYLDVDINYAHGRTVAGAKGANYIPLAPVWTSAGGITFTNKNGFNGSLRYRFIGDRPANELYTLRAKGYFITDAVLSYKKPGYEIGFVLNNMLNSKWKETQFDTNTRLKGEVLPVEEICFTPGTKLAAKVSVAFFFK